MKGKGRWNNNYGGQSGGYGSKGQGKGDKCYQVDGDKLVDASSTAQGGGGSFKITPA